MDRSRSKPAAGTPSSEQRVCCYLTVACVGQPFTRLMQVTQTRMDHAVRVAGQLGAVPVTRSGSTHTLVLRTDRGVAQTDTVPGDTPTNTNTFISGKLETVNKSQRY